MRPAFSLPILALLLALARIASAAEPAPLPPVPTAEQLAWQRGELTMFLHFGVNTFTDREWGDGTESEKVFNPSALDARQWARTAKEAGFKLMILTAKHHDGFCLWPSRYTEHSVKNSPWKDGRGDVVREFVEACRAEGLKVGLYLSPWDRNHRLYGSDAYNDYFVNQLTELLTNYGRIDELWFDGACGEGPNGKKQVYDWNRYYATIRKLAPQALIAICGPDIRWVGNESGVARIGESSVREDGKGPDGKPRLRWYPAECDVSIRPGWFYHAGEDAKVKSLAKLMEIYFASVGRNSVLLLNVPPDRRGLMADADVARLKEFGAAVRALDQGRLKAQASAPATEPFAAARAIDGKVDTYWAAPSDAKPAALELDFGTPQKFNVLNVQEPIALGERVTKYHIDAEQDGRWQTLAYGTVIGHRNLHPLPETAARRVRLVIDAHKAAPCIAEFSVHRASSVPPPAELPVTANKPAKASDVHGNETNYGADKAIDGDESTRWATNDRTRDCYLEVDLERSQPIGRLVIREFESRITRFALEYRETENAEWRVAHTGAKVGKKLSTKFPPVMARWVRLHILEATFAPSIWEFQVFRPAEGQPWPVKHWTRTGPLGELPKRVTEAYPLADQQNTKGWTKSESLSDEFTGKELDLAKWTLGGEVWRGRPPALFSDKNVTVADGKLHLTMRKEKTPPELAKAGFHDYTSASLYSKLRAGYGYYEVKARPMNSAGSSAFWFQREETPGWLTEIDVFEIGGNARGFEQKYHMTLHVFRTPQEKRHWSVGGVWVAPWRLADDYHVYGLEWDAQELKFHVDGVLVRTVENTHWHQPLRLIFDSETMPDWFGLPSDQDLPSTFSVEYVRAWQKKP